MSISQKCISAQANKPVMGTVQDCLVGLHILTEPGTVFDKAHACRMIAVTVHCERKLPAPCLNVGGARRCTRATSSFSCLLPDRVYLEPAIEELHRGLAEGDAPVLIRGGRLPLRARSKATPEVRPGASWTRSRASSAACTSSAS